MNRYEKRLLRAKLNNAARSESRAVSRMSSSTNPDRIRAIMSHMVTPNWTREGSGRQVWVDRIPTRNQYTGEIQPTDIYRLSSRTKKHTIPPSYSGNKRYR